MSETEQETKQEDSSNKEQTPENKDDAQANGEDAPETTESKTKSENESTEQQKSDADEEDESEEELPPGLLEQPVAILQAKRERKKVERFTYDDIPTPSSEKKKLEIKEGKGLKLGEHPRVEWHLNRNKGEDLKIIHKLFFGVFGDAHHCKKNIRNFSGFVFEKDSSEYEKKEEYLGRFTLDNLKWAMTVCDVENKKGKKDDLIESLLDWCLNPKPSGKPVPKKRVKGEKRKSKGKQKPRKSKDTSQNEANETISSDDLSSDSESDEETKTKVTKSPNPVKKKSPQKKKSSTGSPKMIAKVKIGHSKKESISSDDSDDDDVPLKKKKSAPTNAQIRKSVEKILKGADLEQITMKAVCLKVYDMYPDFDLSERKPFIKQTVKEIIS